MMLAPYEVGVQTGPPLIHSLAHLNRAKFIPFPNFFELRKQMKQQFLSMNCTQILKDYNLWHCTSIYLQMLLHLCLKPIYCLILQTKPNS